MENILGNVLHSLNEASWLSADFWFNSPDNVQKLALIVFGFIGLILAYMRVRAMNYSARANHSQVKIAAAEQSFDYLTKTAEQLQGDNPGLRYAAIALLYRFSQNDKASVTEVSGIISNFLRDKLSITKGCNVSDRDHQRKAGNYKINAPFGKINLTDLGSDVDLAFDVIIELAQSSKYPVNLHGISLAGRHLNGIKFKNIDFSYCNFSGSVFSDSKFSKCTLSGSSLKKAIFDRSEFSECYVAECNFEESRFQNSRIMHSTVVRCAMDRMEAPGLGNWGWYCYETSLTCANLLGTGFFMSSIINCDLSGADLRKSKTYQDGPTSFKGTKLTSTDFRGSYLYFANNLDPSTFNEAITDGTLELNFYERRRSKGEKIRWFQQPFFLLSYTIHLAILLTVKIILFPFRLRKKRKPL